VVEGGVERFEVEARKSREARRELRNEILKAKREMWNNWVEKSGI